MEPNFHQISLIQRKNKFHCRTAALLDENYETLLDLNSENYSVERQLLNNAEKFFFYLKYMINK